MRIDPRFSYSGKYLAASREQLIEKVQERMSQKRLIHVLGVEQAALELAKQFGASLEKASIAALTHDYAKERSAAEFEHLIQVGDFDLELLNYGNEIWHGLVGATLVQNELGIVDEESLNAIRRHTTGAKEMTLLDKIIYVADYIEPGRSFPGVEKARSTARVDLDAAVAFETQQTLLYLVERGVKIYPKTLETYNQWVAQK